MISSLQQTVTILEASKKAWLPRTRFSVSFSCFVEDCETCAVTRKLISEQHLISGRPKQEKYLQIKRETLIGPRFCHITREPVEAQANTEQQHIDSKALLSCPPLRLVVGDCCICRCPGSRVNVAHLLSTVAWLLRKRFWSKPQTFILFTPRRFIHASTVTPRSGQAAASPQHILLHSSEAATSSLPHHTPRQAFLTSTLFNYFQPTTQNNHYSHIDRHSFLTTCSHAWPSDAPSSCARPRPERGYYS